MAVEQTTPAAGKHPAYDLAVDLLAGLVQDAFLRDSEGVLKKANENRLLSAAIKAADEEANDDAIDAEVRRELAARFGCEPGKVIRLR